MSELRASRRIELQLPMPIRRRPNRKRGQSMVEFALVAPLLLLLLMGGIDFGRGYLVNSAMTEAVRQGARFGAVHPTWAYKTSVTSPASQAVDPNNIYFKVVDVMQRSTIPTSETTLTIQYLTGGLTPAAACPPTCPSPILAGCPTSDALSPPTPGGTLTASGIANYCANNGIFPFIRVTVSYTYIPMTAVVAKFLPGYPLTAAATLAIE